MGLHGGTRMRWTVKGALRPPRVVFVTCIGFVSCKPLVRGRRPPGGGLVSPWSEDAARQVGAAPAAGRSRARAPRAASRAKICIRPEARFGILDEFPIL